MTTTTSTTPSNRNPPHPTTTRTTTSTLLLHQWVNEFWWQEPGIGIQRLMERCHERRRERLQQQQQPRQRQPESPPQSLLEEESSSQQQQQQDEIAILTALDISKPSIKAAQRAIPYRRVVAASSSSEDDVDGMDGTTDAATSTTKDVCWIQEKIQERQRCRRDKRYEAADAIHADLEARGVVLDDAAKTWYWRNKTEKTKKTSDDEETRTTASQKNDNNNKTEALTTEEHASPTASPTSTTTTITNNNHNNKSTNTTSCQFCGQTFRSRNQVFAHLRDPTSSCGNSIVQSGRQLPTAPSSTHNKTSRGPQRSAQQRTTKQPTPTPSIDACLWMGDVPLPWSRLGGQCQRFRALLRHYVPRSVPTPHIKSMIRKGYRNAKRHKKAQQEQQQPEEQEQQEQDEPTSNNNKCQEDATAVVASGSNHNNSTTTSSDYLGYAIVVFRDADEAKLVRQTLDGTVVEARDVFRDQQQQQQKDDTDAFWNHLPTFTLKVRPAQAEKREKTKNTKSKERTSSTQDGNNVNKKTTALEIANGTCTAMTTTHDEAAQPGQDPPLYQQLGPLSIQELQERHKHWNEFMSSSSNGDGETASPSLDNGNNTNNSTAPAPRSKTQEHQQLVERLVQCYTTRDPRIVIRRQGRLIPRPLQEELLSILTSLRWPVRNERPALSSEQYLVLRSNVKDYERYYGNLPEACRKLLQWADPSYHYSGIAVTKNFLGSPHVDELDQSYQYAISLGDFDQGGELCVSGWCQGKSDSEAATTTTGDYILNVVETHNRIARVDGRQVHWVRTWGTTNQDDGNGNHNPGDRYSLIFYDTSNRNRTTPNPLGVDKAFLLGQDG